MGDFNPDDKNKKFGDKYTYKVPNFTHVNINYFDGDRNELSEYNKVKDINSMEIFLLIITTHMIIIHFLIIVTICLIIYCHIK